MGAFLFMGYYYDSLKLIFSIQISLAGNLPKSIFAPQIAK
jgi:hypothetical protein